MLHRAVPSLGRRADLCLDVTVSAFGQGLREEPFELAGVVTPGGLPVPDAKGGAKDNNLKSIYKTISMTYDESSKTYARQ